ncbi:MAG: hypothetical protein QOF91_659 [Alphaproteobacteria bacterium]|jgi:hypothetical protein|nr:hypothetical protein [Alphaproteobacteria bacterium]
MLSPHATPPTEVLGTRGWLRPARRLLAATALSLFVLGGLGWAALAPIELASRDELFEIPHGTWARRMAGEKIEILPNTIRLTLGINDVLLLSNADEVPQIFGPTLIMPGQSFRLPFASASTYNFACSAHASGQLNVIVEPTPARGWETLRWRLRRLTSMTLAASRHRLGGPNEESTR